MSLQPTVSAPLKMMQSSSNVATRQMPAYICWHFECFILTGMRNDLKTKGEVTQQYMNQTDGAEFQLLK